MKRRDKINGQLGLSWALKKIGLMYVTKPVLKALLNLNVGLKALLLNITMDGKIIDINSYAHNMNFIYLF